uniref:Ig-like domain-containing protein n=1 Tax=Pelusios castaneus TaxID=367368 RepID=A0A8C8RIM1_9SAUR
MRIILVPQPLPLPLIMVSVEQIIAPPPPCPTMCSTCMCPDYLEAVYQLPSISAQARNSVTLPCNFTYPQDIEPVKDLQVSWRRGDFHGEFIYSHSEGFTHPDYQGRIVLVRDQPGNHTASICINHLRTSDANKYFCQLRVQKNDGTWEQWRNIPGTKLKVSGESPPSLA